MLDPRLYRVALVPVLIALLVAAFSLENRSRPIGTTLAPDAFDGVATERSLGQLVREFPNRTPGDVGDEQLAERIAQELRTRIAGGEVTVDRSTGTTLDGERELVTVIGTRPGRPGPGLVVVAHRDARSPGATAELSGTAALLELARVTGEGRLRRTITFVSTSGGSSGNAGAIRAAELLAGQPTTAVLVLGDLGSARVVKPFVVGFSNGVGQVTGRLRRTVETALRIETSSDPGGPRAHTQWARMAVPLTAGEQGPFLEAGLPAVLISASGESGPEPGDPVALDERLESFGRAGLRAITALDNGPDVSEATATSIVTARKVLPAWAVRLLGGVLLLAPIVVIVDGLARMRRRREQVAPWLRWTLLGALPFALAGTVAVLLALTGLLPGAVAAPPAPGALSVDGTAIGVLVALGLVIALAWLVLRPVLVRLAGSPPADRDPGSDAAAIAVLAVAVAVAVAMWAVNPYAGMVLIPAVHLWLAALAPGMRLRGIPGVVLVGLGLAPIVLVWVSHAGALGLGPPEVVWMGVLLVAGGHFGGVTWLLWSLVAGTAVCAAIVAARRPPEEVRPPKEVTVRGPASYAGPGSLGGTESALRRP